MDDGSALPLLTGADAAATAAATAVLRAGGVVVTNARYLHDGRVTVQVMEVRIGRDEATTTRHDLPGYALPPTVGQPRLLLSASAARQLGLNPVEAGWVVATPAPPSQRRQDRFTNDLRAFGGSPSRWSMAPPRATTHRCCCCSPRRPE